MPVGGRIWFQNLCDPTPEHSQHITVNGVPLNALGRIEQVWEDLYGALELVGEPIHVPLRPGAINVPEVLGAREFGVGMLIYGQHNQDFAGHNEKWRELAQLLFSPITPLTVNRVLAFPEGTVPPGGTVPVITTTCQAKYVSGLEPRSVLHGTISKLALRFRNLDGYWYALDDTLATIPAGGGTVALGGDTTTRRISITLSGGTGLQILSNTSTGVSVSFNGDTTANPVVLDVLGFTASQNGVNMAKFVNHSGDVFWMKMRRGDNVFTLTGGGTAAIRARRAYI
jgi:hypothetical protein